MRWIGNNIGDEGAKMMSKGLKTNSSLTKLNLDSDIKKRGIKEVGEDKIIEINSQ